MSFAVGKTANGKYLDSKFANGKYLDGKQQIKITFLAIKVGFSRVKNPTTSYNARFML